MSSVSVVMAVYNGQQFLSDQVESVLAELLPGDELIVINDASSDGSLAFLESIDSSELRIYTNTSNLGVIRSFEQGLQLAIHEFVFLCDQDDVWLPGKRTAFVAAFEQDPAVSVVISDAQVINAQGRVISSSFMASRCGFRGSVWATVWRNRYLGCAMALRHSLLAVALPVPQKVPMHDMWFGAMGAMVGKIVYLPRPFLQYRRHTCNVTSSRRAPFLRMISWRMALLVALFSRILLRMFGFKARQMGGIAKTSDRKGVRK